MCHGTSFLALRCDQNANAVPWDMQEFLNFFKKLPYFVKKKQKKFYLFLKSLKNIVKQNAKKYLLEHVKSDRAYSRF